MPDNVVWTFFKEQRTGPLFSRGTARGGDVTRDVMRATAEPCELAPVTVGEIAATTPEAITAHHCHEREF